MLKFEPITKGKKEIENITSITPTICELMNIQPPSCSNGNIIQSLIEASRNEGISRIDKCLLYAPDAIGTYFYLKYRSLFTGVLQYASIEIPLYSVVPPKTPVCYASMFTGAMPKVHGIQEYKRPVLECDTLFDALVRNGKKTAIVAVANSSIDLIFRNRDIDYFSEEYDPQVTNRTVELIKLDKHDFIVAYHQEYDDTLHKSHPQSEAAIKAVRNHVDSFVKIANQCRLSWKKYNRLVMFAPDHGAHIDPDTGKGTHGKDIPEDMNISHFYGLYKGTI